MSRFQTEVEYLVPFHDVDVMGVVWHGHYLKYFEIARTKLLKSIDYDYPQMRKSGYAWPVVDCRLKYVKPVEYGQQILIAVTLKEYLNRLRFDYLISDSSTKQLLTRGHTIQVAVEISTRTLQLVSPQALLQRIEEGE